MLCRNVADGVARPFGTCTDCVRVCGCLVLTVDGRGVVLLVIDILLLGIPGVANGFGVLVDFSEKGGDGGVGASERPDVDAVLVGGVSMDRSEDVSVGDSSDRGDPAAMPGCNVRGLYLLSSAASAFRSFSLVISVSILRSENSSFSRCASILRDSRSISPLFISSSSMTPRSMV